jgi:hypothetical protein
MEEKEYTIVGNLSDNPKELSDGEMYIKISHWRVFRRILREWLFDNKELEIDIRVLRYKRSLAQNRWMWGVCVPTVRAFVKETSGEVKSKDAIYYWLNTAIVGRDVVIENVMGIEVPVVKGKKFSEMNTKEFSDAVEKIVRHFDALGCHISLPINNNTLNDHITQKDMEDNNPVISNKRG